MRKALMGMILAATVLSPIAAGAQDWRGRDRGGGSARNQNENDGDRGSRGDRGDRGDRGERRQQEAQPAPQQPQPEPQQQVVQRQRGGDGDGDRGGRNRGGDGNDGNRGGRGDRGDRGGSQPSIYPQAWQGDPNSPQLRRYQELERRNQQQGGNRNWRDDRNDRGDRDGRNWRNDRRGDNDGRNWRNDNRRNDWNRSWRDDRRYDWQRWRHTNRNIFRGSRYYSPYRNYGYNRFSIGFFLEPLFFGRNYWLGDPWQYRLPPAPPGTQWVRYYNDVLLVDVYTGEVIDAIYDFFW